MTAHAPLTRDVLIRHYRGEVTIGAHLISPDNLCTSVAADIDAHHDSADPDRNWRRALTTAEHLAGYGLRPLVVDSDGKGGFHPRAFFKKPIPAAVAWWLGVQLRDALEAAGFPPGEFFPKQDGVTLTTPYGNWIRLPGKHHKRDHWSRIYDLKTGRWLEGEDAVQYLVAVAGDDPGRLLDAFWNARADAAATTAPGVRTAPPPKPRRGDRKADEATVREALGFLPADWADNYGGSRADTGWLGVGFALHDWDTGRGLDLWEEFSRRSPKYEPGVCAAKWGSFTAGGGLTLGTIFHAAEANGWTPPWRRPGRTPSSRGQAGPAADAAGHGPPEPEPPRDVAELRARAVAFTTWAEVLADRNFLTKLAVLAAADRTAALLVDNDLREGTLKKVYKARDIKAALKQFRPGPREPAEAAPAPGTVRASIEDTHERHIVRAEALAVLPHIADLFVRGRVLVRIARHANDEVKVGGGTLRDAKGLAHVAPLGKAGLSCQLAQVAEFFHWRTGAEGEAVAYPVHPPAWLPEALLEYEEYPGVRDLRGVAECPFPRPDGTIVTDPGYDPATGVFLAPAFALDPLPEAPDRERARAAARDLFALVKQFPFAGETDEDRADNFAAWLAGLLGVLARPAIEGEVPGVAFCGNKAGTGKGRLIDLIGVIAAGRRIATANYPEDKAEFVKFKVSLALAALQAIHVDNLEEGTAYGGDVIDSALTSSNPGDRILGGNKTPEGIELRTCWFLSGNNVSPRKDAYRRWLVCNLKTDLEHPEERDDFELEKILAYALERRAELARDALIILKAHAAAGRPKGPWPGRLGSFEEWDEVVRGAVWYATGRDCYATQRKGSAKAPERQKKLALLEGWYAIPHQAQGVTTRNACALAKDHKDGLLAILWNALLDYGKNGEPATHVSLGMILRAMEGSVLEVGDDKIRFERHGTKDGAILWRVVKVVAQPPTNRNATSDICLRLRVLRVLRVYQGARAKNHFVFPQDSCQREKKSIFR